MKLAVAWVNDSEPEAQFQETVNKSKAMLNAVALAEKFAKIYVAVEDHDSRSGSPALGR